MEKNVPIYSELDSKFKDNHFKLSVQLINKIVEAKYFKFSDINKEEVLNNLNNCILNKNDYKLNKKAFVLNTGNLKHSKICETISNLNISINEKLRQVDGFNLNTESVFNKIDDLVQRRNEIAHGNVQSILNTNEIVAYLDFIEKYLYSIGIILKDEAYNLDLKFKLKHICTEIKDFTIFKGNILGITNGGQLNLKIDDEILLEKSNSELLLCKIITLKKFQDSNSITLKIDKNLRDTFKFYKFNFDVSIY